MKTKLLALWVVSTATLAAQPWQFGDATAQAGLEGVRVVSGTPEKEFLVETMTGGVCVLDYDGDGRPDLYFANGTTREHWNQGSGPSGMLLRNTGGVFEDVTEKAGVRDSSWSMGCVAADYDGDGRVDLYVTNFGPNLLFRNRGDGTFEEVAKKAGVDDGLWSTGAAFADYDGDGDLDLYLANYVDFDFDKPAGDPRFCAFRGVSVACGPRGLPGAPDRLFRNRGNGTFEDVSSSAGIGSSDKLYGFQPVFSDFDMDGDLDVFVANDSRPNFLWKNNGDGTFSDEALFSGIAYNQEGREQACMGVDVADYDQDGDFDIYSTNFSDDYHVLYRNGGEFFFADATFKAKIAQNTFQYLGFGALFADFDNDGRMDIFAANGHIYPEVDKFNLGSTYKQSNQLFRGLGSNRFEELSSKLGAGLALVKSSRGAALLDYDSDGDLDLVVSNLDDRVDLLRNDLADQKAWLRVSLKGEGANTQAVGAKVTAVSGSQRWLQEVRAGSSYLSDSQRVLHFGLGDVDKVDHVEVVWPSGRKQIVKNVPLRARIVLAPDGSLRRLR
ncbi:MAG TPA: CRTAC1 family protein [Acidobacteriota bacterium]|nr:CRTAC1 family protein [Acidobacteriota bacterium]